MVYYYTSGNIKMLRNILIDYGAASEVSPYEYMKSYIEKCPDAIEDGKISWIAETFLGIQKHRQFLKSISSHLSDELCDEEQDYFVIVFHAVIFQLETKDMQFLYKSLFNLNKLLLNTFTKFLENNEVLTFISHVAQSYYDTNYITEKIITPLFTWQPYISEMGHDYCQYVKKLESRKAKAPTVPIQPNVLNRKSKQSSTQQYPACILPSTPPNSLGVKSTKKMLTKNTIDQKLQQIHEKNKQKAEHLLNDVKNNDHHYAQDKSDKFYIKTISNIRDEIENECSKPLVKQRQKFVIKHKPPQIKDTTATLKKMSKQIQLTEQNEIQWLEDLMKSCKNTGKALELEEYDRQERKREILYDIERKHLVGQISHEEALIAKKKFQEENRKKYAEFLKEKESWNEEIERWKKIEMEKNRKQVEKASLLELNLIQAKHDVTTKKKEVVDKLKMEAANRQENAFKKKQEELEKRINMIKEIKILTIIAKKAQIPKIIDLTETSGFGFLCEMSIAELQERLSIMKIGLKEELERKKNLIKQNHMNAKQELEEARTSIKNFIAERAMMRKQLKAPVNALKNSPPKEINELKRILEEKRQLRMQLTANN